MANKEVGTGESFVSIPPDVSVKAECEECGAPRPLTGHNRNQFVLKVRCDKCEKYAGVKLTLSLKPH